MFEFKFVDAVFDSCDAPPDVVGVDGSGLADEGCFFGESGNEEVWVDGYAMSSDAASRGEDVDAGVEVGEADEGGGVDACIFADDG